MMNGVNNMESVGGVQSCIHGTSSSKRGRLSCFQGSVLWFLIFSAQINWAASKRNLEVLDPTSPTIGVWNKTELKDIRHCLDFHEANFSSYFYYWPEDSFQYCCNGFSPQKNLSNYRYSNYGSPIGFAVYYDLGLIDECLPYWSKKCHHLYDSYEQSPVFLTGCEYTDVIHLYNDRFWRLIFGKYGLAMTALPLIGLLQLSVVLVITLEVVYWRYWHSKVMDKTDMSVGKLKAITKRWINGSWKNAWMDWVHLCLLSIIGNGLVEAIGRTDPYGWQAKTFYRYSMVYLSLSVILWVSSFLHQVTHWIAVDKKETKKWNEESSESAGGPDPDVVGDGTAEASTSQHSDPASETSVPIDQKTDSNLSETPNSYERKRLDPDVAAELRKLLKLDKIKDPVVQLRKLLQLGPDWKWQPIAAQTAILFCLWAYLTYPGDGDGLSSTLLGFLVQAASPWSGLYACRVLFLTLPFLLKKLLNVHHIRHLLRSPKPKQDSKSMAKKEAEWERKKWIHWGRVLCCVGCCSPKPGTPKKKIEDTQSSSSSSSDIEN